MNVTKNLISIAVLGLASFAANAGNSTGTISMYIARVSDGMVFVQISSLTGTAACASGNAGSYTVNGTTAGGAVVANRLSSAFALGKTVLAVGTGACTAVAGYEDLLQVNIAP